MLSEFQIGKVIKGVTASLLLLPAACSKSDLEKLLPSSNTDGESETSIIVQDEPVYVFAGTSFETIPNDVRRGNFVLELDLLSDPAQASSVYTDVSPPMPFMSRPVSLYLTEQGYKVQLSSPNFESTGVTAGQVNARAKIKIVNSQTRSVVYFNGEKLWDGDRLHSISETTLGKGFKQRYWSGKVYHYALCSFPVIESPDEFEAVAYEYKCEQ